MGLPEPIVFREAHWTFHTADEIRRSLADTGLEEITLTDPSYAERSMSWVGGLRLPDSPGPTMTDQLMAREEQSAPNRI